MRKLSLFFPLSIALALVMLVSCEKEGAEGPAGPPGPAGNQGPQGPPGPKGDSGVANVIYSDWLDVQFEYGINEDGDTTGLQAIIDAPKLTKEILSQGEIKVYVNFGTAADPFVFPLPYIEGEFNLTPVFFEGTIGLLSNGDLSTITDAGEKFFQYRYVLIPGGVLAVKPADVNLDIYADVQQFLNIKN